MQKQKRADVDKDPERAASRMGVPFYLLFFLIYLRREVIFLPHEPLN